MLITNLESLNMEELFPCKSGNLKRFLCEHKGMNFISKSYNEEERRCTWYFMKSPDLQEYLQEWTNNKITGNLLFPKAEISK